MRLIITHDDSSTVYCYVMYTASVVDYSVASVDIFNTGFTYVY